MTVILVEGASDRVAIEVLAARRGVALPRIVVLGGAHGARRAARDMDGERVLGLVDANERRLFDGVVDRVFVCDPDLEGELIRALGVDGVAAVISSQHERDSFRRLQKQPAQRTAPVERQLARFFGGRSGNKERYARLLSEAVALDRIPPPIDALLDALV